MPLTLAASGVAWKSGKDVTVKVMKKKPKPGGCCILAIYVTLLIDLVGRTAESAIRLSQVGACIGVRLVVLRCASSPAAA